MLAVPRGGFHDINDALAVRLKFDCVPFKVFVMAAALAERICGVSQSVRDSIERIDAGAVMSELQRAKQLFYFHTRDGHTDTVRSYTMRFLPSVTHRNTDQP